MEARRSSEKIRVLLVDDHVLIRRGIARVLNGSGLVEVVGEASDGEAGIELAVRRNPDVLLMDLAMPGVGGEEATRLLRDRLPGMPVLVLTGALDGAGAKRALDAGARGYVQKRNEVDGLVRAIQAVHSGETYVTPEVTRLLAEPIDGPVAHTAASALLSDRQLEVLSLLGAGKTNLEIGRKLDIHEATVRTHVSHIAARLGLANRTQVALYAARNGYAAGPGID